MAPNRGRQGWYLSRGARVISGGKPGGKGAGQIGLDRAEWKPIRMIDLRSITRQKNPRRRGRCTAGAKHSRTVLVQGFIEICH